MTDSTDLATLVMLLGRLERLNEAFVTDACRRHGVTPAELRVLAALRHGVAQGPVRPTDIGRWVVQTSGGLTATLRRLENDGRIARVADDDDGRVRLVALTDDGARFYDELLDELVDRYARAFADLDVHLSLEAIRPLLAAFERTADTAASAGWHVELEAEAAS